MPRPEVPISLPPEAQVPSKATLLPVEVIEKTRDPQRRAILIIKKTDRNAEIMEKWSCLAGTEIRYDEEGNFVYPIYNERKRVNDVSLYAPVGELPQNWSLERLLQQATRRPISEMVMRQIRKDEGSVEAGIRSVDHVLRRHRVRGGEEVEEVALLLKQVDRGFALLSRYPGRMSPAEFDRSFEELHQQTKEVLGKLRMGHVSLQLKRDLASLVDRGTKGTDKDLRRNPSAVIKIFASARRLIERRMVTIDFIRPKYNAMRVALMDERRRSRQTLKDFRKEMGMGGLAGHSAFRPEGKGRTEVQRGVLLHKLEVLIEGLGQIKLKPYRPLARELIERLGQARGLLKEGHYPEAKRLFEGAQAETETVLEDPRFRRIYPKEEMTDKRSGFSKIKN